MSEHSTFTEQLGKPETSQETAAAILVQDALKGVLDIAMQSGASDEVRRIVAHAVNQVHSAHPEIVQRSLENKG